MRIQTILPFFLITIVSLFAQEGVLTVGIKESPPFTIKEEGGNWSGLMADMWMDIAQKQKLEFEWKELPLHEILDRVEGKTLDVGVAALTITEERERLSDFSHPVYSDGLAIAVRAESDTGILAFVMRFLSIEFLTAVFALLLLLFIFGFLIWVFERKKNQEDFGGTSLQGMGSGLWWSAVTMTTVGYGDKAPKTFLGRCLAMVWMFSSIIVISGFTASIASSLTVNSMQYSVNSVEDLKKVRVAVIDGTTGVEYMKEQRSSYKVYPDMIGAFNSLGKKEVDAVLYDRPIMLHHINQNNLENIKLLKDNINQEMYAFLVQEGSELREKINLHLLENVNGEDWPKMLDKYLGSGR